MKKHLIKYFFFALCFCAFSHVADAQTKSRKSSKRNTVKKTTKTKYNNKFQASAPATVPTDTVAKVVTPAPVNDSLPIKKVLKSLRPDEAVNTIELKDRIPLAYEHLRADDAVYRQRIWREIDTREKINMPFRYAADENNGNQRFMSILMQAIQDSAVTVFNSIDDRFTTPMTKAEVAKAIVGDPIPVPIIDSNGVQTGVKMESKEINLDSIYRYHIKEEVIFDKESSRLFWRILGIAPVMDVVTSQGVDLGPSELFWVYYPDMRPILAKYDVYNGKNYGGRMSWEELFEERMFSGRIIKSSIDNPFDLTLSNTPGLKDNTLFQLLQGENIKDQIFNYEQDLWSY